MSKIWATIKSFFKSLLTWVLRYPAAIIASIFIIIIVVVLWKFGRKIQIGGLLDKIWGRDVKKINSRVTIVAGRIDPKGSPIQPGVSDDRGYVQAPVSTEIKEPGIFSNPSVIEIVDDGKEIKIPLPVGVSNTDVKEVIRINPNIYEVRDNDGGLSVHELNDLEKVLDP